MNFELPERLAGLEELAENLWWSWHPSARALFKMLNRQAWKETRHNPDKMLRELPREILESAADNPEYLRHYDLDPYIHDIVIKIFHSMLGVSANVSGLTFR